MTALTVSRDTSDYATGPQITQALDELTAWRRTFGAHIRATPDGRDRWELIERRNYLGQLIRALRTGLIAPMYVLAHASPIECAPTWRGIADRYYRADQWARAEANADEATQARDVTLP